MSSDSNLVAGLAFLFPNPREPYTVALAGLGLKS